MEHNLIRKSQKPHLLVGLLAFMINLSLNSTFRSRKITYKDRFTSFSSKLSMMSPT